MAQTVPLVAQLGAANTGLTIGYTVLNLDRSQYAAFSAVGVGESGVLGTYYVADGITVPDAGGYIVVGESGTDLVEVAVDAAPLDAAGTRASVGLAAADLDDQLAAIAASSGLTAQQTRDALKLAPSSGAAAAGSIDDLLGDIKTVTDALDVTAVTQVAASNAGHLTITAGLTFDESVTGLTIPADWVSAIWTLKANVRDADTAALVQLRVTNPGAGGDGLQRVNGVAPAAPITAAAGELTVNQAGGAITIYQTDELTALLAAAVDLGWDVKFIDAGGDSSGQRGTADVVLTETRATT